jgi:Zn-dependent protease
VFERPDAAQFAHVVRGTTPGASAGAAVVLSILFSLNLLLGVFNLLPLPPLDGFGAAGLLLSEDAAGRFQQFGHQLRGFSMVGLLVAWQLFDPVFEPLFTFSLRVLYPGYAFGS